MTFVPTKVVAFASALAFLSLGSSSASALSSWDFTGTAGGMSANEVFLADDGSPVTVSGYTQLLAETPSTTNLTFPNVLHQTPDGIGVGTLSTDLDAVPPAFLCFFGCVTTPAVGLDLIRLSVAGAGWHAKSISISLFDDPENVWVFGGGQADGSDAVLLNMLVGVTGNPDVFALDDTDAFNFFFIAAVADIEACPAPTIGAGFCGTPSDLRIAGFVGQNAVLEPSTMALFGVGIFGMGMLRRRQSQQA
jgi:hypothetical protein